MFLDEIGQAKEPEAIIPLTGLIDEDCHVIMAGDPYQLGPTIRNNMCLTGSHLFKESGLGILFLYIFSTFLNFLLHQIGISNMLLKY